MTVRYQPTGATASEISASIETGVRDGHLAAGDPLPPVRALAADLRVSPATVAAAYASLRQRGIVETAGRNGTRVRARPALRATRRDRRLPIPAHLRDLASGYPDPRLLPDLSPAFATLAAERTTTGYVAEGVLPEMADAIQAAYAADGIDMATAGVALSGGALDAIERLLGVHLRPGDRVAVEDPGWANLLDLVAALGLSAHPVPVDDEGPTPAGLRAALSAGVRAFVVTSRAHNPTGASVTAARAASLRAVLAAHPDILVIEDDHAGELSATPLHTLAGATASWAFVRSVSKPYGPDLRLATLAGDEATIARFVGRQRVGAGWVSTVLQRLVLALWSSSSSTVDRARSSYETRRTALVSALAARGVAARGRTGINVWIPVPDETVAVAGLRDAGYAVAPGSLYRLATPPGVRVTVSGLDLADIEPFADAVVAALSAAPAGHSA